MTERTRLTLHPAWQIDTVSPLIFGGFLEHMGRAVYEGVYDPKSTHADAEGIRTDVLDALKALKMTIMRYPGGNFASGYHWQDGIGPREQRPTVRELAWQSIEPNQFGTDEFIALCRKAEWEPMLCVNLGTGTPEEARDWVEYCNAPTGTRWSDLRAQNGNEAPHAVKYWCLGNEMDGAWQLGHVPAAQYAILAQQAAKMMRDCDRSIEAVACGSCDINLPTYLKWDLEVLDHLAGIEHYVSLHRYAGNRNDCAEDFLAIGNSIDAQIEAMAATTAYIQAKHGKRRRTQLCFDEWNVWYKSPVGRDAGGGVFAPHLIEEVYNLEDALVVASFLMSFIRHADSVKIANIAQIVNVIAPLLTRGDELLKQSIYYAFAMISARKHGVALKVNTQGPSYTSPLYGETTLIDNAAIWDEDARLLHLFAMNRDPLHPADLEVDIPGATLREQSCELLSGPDLKACNRFDAPDTVRSEAVQLWDQQRTQLPPASFLATNFEVR